MPVQPDTYTAALFDENGRVTFPLGLNIPRDPDAPAALPAGPAAPNPDHSVSWLDHNGAVTAEIGSYRQGGPPFADASQIMIRGISPGGDSVAGFDFFTGDTGAIGGMDAGQIFAGARHANGNNDIAKLIDGQGGSDFARVDRAQRLAFNGPWDGTQKFFAGYGGPALIIGQLTAVTNNGAFGPSVQVWLDGTQVETAQINATVAANVRLVIPIFIVPVSHLTYSGSHFLQFIITVGSSTAADVCKVSILA